MTDDSHSPLWRVLGTLAETPKKSGSNYEARCPAHEDQHASLSIGSGLDGRVLLKCHAGCPPEKVVAALGLQMADLFERSAAGNQVRRFHLINPNGKVVAVHVREDVPGDKQMWWESGGKKGLNGTKLEQLPLYRLPDLLAAPEWAPVIVCEGEAAADALAELGLIAVGTATGAAGTPSSASLEPLQGHEVWLWPDNDNPGRDHMQRIAQRLEQKPKWIDWKTAPPKGDAADYVKAGGTAAGVATLVSARPAGPRLSVVRMSEVQPEPIEWLWNGRLARGKPTLLMGDPGLGKSLITHTVAAITSVGGAWPDGGHSQQGAAILFTVEDGLADTVSPRLHAAHADMSRVIAVRGVLEKDATLDERMFTLTEHLALLEDLVVQERAVFVAMDPITAYLGADINSHHEADVRAVLGPLSQLAERTRIALVMVMHLNKGSGVSALYRAAGSIAFPAVARVVLGVAPDPNDEDNKRRLLLPIKLNIGTIAAGIGYRIETVRSKILRHADEGEQPPVIVFDNEPVLVDATSAMDRAGTPQEMSALAEVKTTILQILANGRVPAVICKKEIADATGVRSETTLTRARKELRVKVRKEGFQGSWYWELTEDPSRARARADPFIPVNAVFDANGCADDRSNDSNDSNDSLNPRAHAREAEPDITYCATCGRNLTPEAYAQHLPCQQFAKNLTCRVCGNELPDYLANIGLHYDCREDLSR